MSGNTVRDERIDCDENTLAELSPLSASPLRPSKPIRPGWRWCLLTDVARLATGHTPSRREPKWWGGDIHWLQLPDIRAVDGRRVMRTLEQTNELGLANSSAVLLPQGTVCMSRTASVGFVTILGRPMATSQDFVNWVCGPELDPDFLMYLIIRCRREIRDLGSGATHHSIYFETVENFSVCIPPIEEQRRIAGRLKEKLATVECTLAAAQARLKIAQALPAAYLRQAFEGVESSDWETVTIGDTCTLLPSRSIATAGDTLVRAITTACLSERGFISDGVKTARMHGADVPDCLARQGEVLVARSNTPELVGRASMYDGVPSGVVATDLTIRVWPRENLDAGYLATFLSYLFQTGYWREKAGGASASMKKITREQLLAQEIRIPPRGGVDGLQRSIVEQRRIATDLARRLGEAERLAEIVRAEVAIIESLPTALLREAFQPTV